MNETPKKTWASWCEKHDVFHHPDEPCIHCEFAVVKEKLEKAEQLILKLRTVHYPVKKREDLVTFKF